MAQRLIEEYLALAGHGADAAGPVFRPVTNNRTKELEKPLNPNSIYRNIILKYGLETASAPKSTASASTPCAPPRPPTRSRMRRTSLRFRDWLGQRQRLHITSRYDRRKVRPEDSPTFRVRY